ncbi:hypothetical protein SSX86_011942 [Deinandra increscens subsp. villosa]|uniref:TF-B3 domain-containing protein n=1 Tax=Deinandra increscens subsp. villosa TaxID=3103831 RepID=A0AAP0H035_9ASTR
MFVLQSDLRSAIQIVATYCYFNPNRYDSRPLSIRTTPPRLRPVHAAAAVERLGDKPPICTADELHSPSSSSGVDCYGVPIFVSVLHSASAASYLEMDTSFTRVFSTTEDKRLKIPDDFAEIRYGNLQSTTSVTLVFTTNMSWDIKIKKFNESLYITTGWSQVVKDILLKENHFLEFEYENESVVHLHVYNEDGSNILLVPQDVKSECETDRSAEEAVSQPPTYNKVVVVRKHFRLPTELAKLANFYDGKKIKLAFEHGEARTFKLRSQSNMVTYERFTIKSWKRFADHYGITVNQKVQLTYAFQTTTLFVHRAL